MNISTSNKKETLHAINESKSPNLDCWQSKDHPLHFDYRMHFPSFSLKYIYENLNEFKLCRNIFSNRQKFSLLDVGCASGEIGRYFRLAYPWVQYTGCDISQTAIERAKMKYPQAEYKLTDFELSQFKRHETDYLFCRDVVIHQQDPFKFLRLIGAIPKQGLILRLRTRDKGATELDPEKSCQLNYGQWAPYMVINCNDLISFFKQLEGCNKIHIIKNYMILGGQHARFLPKDCYLEETGTSETTAYVEFSEKSSPEIEVVVEVGKESLSTPVWARGLRFLIKRLTSGHKGKVWW